jgi:outer membrane protein assembly factor BamB
VALIELDLYAPAELAAGRAPQGRRPFVGLAAVVVLVLALAGATPMRSVLWRRVGLAPIIAPDGAYQLVGDRLYTFDWAENRLVTTAWSLEPLRRLWSRTATTPTGDSGVIPGFGWSVEPVAGDDIVLQSYLNSLVVDDRTGTVRWSSPEPLIAVSGGRVGLVYDQEFRPGTQYDEATGAAGPLYVSATGVFHTEPPVRTTLRALDLRTGRPLWRSGFAGQVITVDGRTDPGTIVVVASGRLSVLAAATGAVLRERTLPGPAPRDLSSWDVAGDLVLRQDTPGGGTVTAYSMVTLAPVWQRPVPASSGVSRCGGMLCEDGEAGTTVLDPGTGTPRWRSGVGTALIDRGRSVVEVQNRENRPVAVRDAATGAVLVDLDGWTWFAYGREGGALVLGRLDGPRTLFGVVGADRREIQPLGYAPTPVTNCESTDRYVACRNLGGVDVWAFLS